jgi:hypothetical protein
LDHSKPQKQNDNFLTIYLADRVNYGFNFGEPSQAALFHKTVSELLPKLTRPQQSHAHHSLPQPPLPPVPRASAPLTSKPKPPDPVPLDRVLDFISLLRFSWTFFLVDCTFQHDQVLSPCARKWMLSRNALPVSLMRNVKRHIKILRGNWKYDPLLLHFNRHSSLLLSFHFPLPFFFSTAVLDFLVSWLDGNAWPGRTEKGRQTHYKILKPC